MKMKKVIEYEKQKCPRAFEDAVSLLGFSKFNYFLILASGGALMSVILETMGSTFILPAAQCDLNLSLSEKSLLYSISFFGVVSSSYIWGYVADTRGRKIVVLISLTVSATLSVICSFVAAPWLFISLRYMNGFFIGGSSAITYAYAGEFHDNSHRSSVIAWIASSVAWGALVIPSLAWLVLAQTWSFEIPFLGILFRPWRLLMIIYAIPSIIFTIMVCFLPESPKYLLMQGKDEEVLGIMKNIYAINTGRSKESYPVSYILWDEGVLEDKKSTGFFSSLWRQTKPLFTKHYFFKTILICYLQFAIFFANNSIYLWYPEILNSMSAYQKVVSSDEVTMCKSLSYNEKTDNLTDTILDLFLAVPRAIASDSCTDSIDSTSFIIMMILGVAFLFCYIPIASIIDRVGARNLIYIFIPITTISGICAQFLSGYNVVQITLGIYLMNAPCISIINAINVELYPTQFRGMALSISLMFGRIGAMTGSTIMGPLMLNACDYIFYIFAALLALVVIVVIILPNYKPVNEENDKSNERSV